MKSIKIALLTLATVAFVGSSNAQLIGGKKGKKGTEIETGGKEAFDQGVQKGREDARLKLKPYKYDGSKSTYYSYKTYTYAKEIEVLTVQKTDYKFSFNATMIKDNIGIKVYDKPKTQKGRILLFESDDIGNADFELKLDELNETFRAEKLAIAQSKATADAPLSEAKAKMIGSMRLKKVYINYIIPAVDRVLQVDEVTGDKTSVIEYAAMVLAVGYKFL